MKTKTLKFIKRDTYEELISKINSISQDISDISIVKDSNGDWIGFYCVNISDNGEESPEIPKEVTSQPSVPAPANAGVQAPAAAPDKGKEAPTDKQKFRLKELGYSEEQIKGFSKQDAFKIIKEYFNSQ